MTAQATAYREATAPHTGRTTSDSHAAVDTVEAAAPGLAAKMGQMMEAGKSRVTEWRGGAQGGIRARPIRSVLIAAAVGAVIGLLVGRRIA